MVYAVCNAKLLSDVAPMRPLLSQYDSITSTATSFIM